MTYRHAVESLFALAPELSPPDDKKTRRKFDLEHMRVLAAALGNPERRFPSVLVAGTNGKGSTAATLAAILGASGYSAGLYTSPHLIRPNERIRLQGEQISDPEFAEMHARVQAVAEELVRAGSLPQHPSFFEMMTAMAFEYFASAGVELAVLEVGIGGRLDATNIAGPLISVIADVDFDHMEWLGDTLDQIAREKAGIIQKNGLLVTLPQHRQVNDAIGEIAVGQNARAVNAAAYLPPMTPAADAAAGLGDEGYALEVLGRQIQVISPLRGRHQKRNVALAIAAAVELAARFGFSRITPQAIEQGIRETDWPGRFQRIPPSASRPEIVLDVAHNPAGAWALRSALSQFYDGRPITIVFGAMRDKAIAEIAQILFPVAERIVATHSASVRAASSEEISQAAQATGSAVTLAQDVPAALEAAFAQTPGNGVVVVTGSVYLVGAALGELGLAAAREGGPD